MPVSYRLHDRCRSALGSWAENEHEGGGGRPFAFASSPRQFERDRPFVVDHLKLELTLEVEARSVSGTATLDVRRVDASAESLVLDALGFSVSRVTVDGSEVLYQYDGKAIVVPVGRELGRARVAVTYRATPRRGMYFLEPDEHVPNRPRQVWTQCQEEDARHFVPCQDKPHVKMTTEAVVVAPRGWSVLSNGALVEKQTPADGPWTFHWKMEEPHASYLLTIVAGEFTELEDRAAVGDRDVPLSYWVPKGREEDGLRTYARTKDMVRLFGELVGVDYPWNKYAQVTVSDFIFGGMENTTATTMYEYILLDARAAIDVSSDDLIAHELAHQWFGDFVTCRDWSEGWLNEGFATYFEHVWREKHLGMDEYDYGIRADLSAYVSEATGRYRRPIVCHEYDAPLDLFDRHLYEKGSLVLHHLRTELGSETFWRGVHRYLTRHGKSIVETRDLLRALEDVSGRSLGKIFDQLVYKPGHPEIEVDVSWDKGVLKVGVKQRQSATDGVPSVFEVPLVLDIVGDAGVRRERLALTQRSEVFAIPYASRPTMVVVDPHMLVLGEVHVKAPDDMLHAQLVGAPTARGRWLAAQALATATDPVTIGALSSRLEDEAEFWGVRVQVAEALARIRSRECFETLAKNARTAHPKVRRAVVDALGRFKTSSAVDVLRPIALKDASYLVEAEAARALGRTKQPSAFDVLLDVIDRPSWADVIRAAALDGLSSLRDDRGAPHVLARVRYGHPARVRRSAVMAVPKLIDGRRAREALEDLLEDADANLRIDVVRALAELGDLKARAALRSQLDTDLDPRVRRRIREVLRELGGETKKAADQLREELEKLSNEAQELKGRIATIEAKVGLGASVGSARLEAPDSNAGTTRPKAGPRSRASKLRAKVGKATSPASKKAGRTKRGGTS